jgi:hypothetical protein
MAMASGLYGLTLEKFLIDTMGMSIESETLVKMMLVQDAYTPNFDTHNFRDDVTNEPGGSGTYATGGSVLTTTELTVASPAATQIKYDTDDLSWTGTTITARGGVHYHVTGGASSTDPIIGANAFAGDVVTSGGTFTYQVHANGHWFIDYA